MQVDRAKIEQATRLLLEALGEDPTREGLRDTPRRVAAFWEEFFAGQRQGANAVFHERYDEMIVLRDIPFWSICEHHLLPFYGVAHIGYLPDQEVIGLSKIVRLLDYYAHQLQVQERLTVQVAEALELLAKARGVGVVIQATHLCMAMRGVRRENVVTVTSCLRGKLLTEPEARQEFLSLIRDAH